MQRWLRRRGAYVLMILASVIPLLALILYPTIRLVQLALTNENPLYPYLNHFVGLGNFTNFLSDQDAIHSLTVTLTFVAAAVGIETVIGTGAAIIIQPVRRGARALRTALLVPMVVAPIVVGVMWNLLLDPTLGVIDYFLGLFGIPPIGWLGGASTALWSIIVIDVWEWSPFIMLMMLAALEALPREPFEAAVVDGASGTQILRHVTLPMVRPMLVVAILLRTVFAFKTFEIIYTTTNGGPGTATDIFNIHIYNTAFVSFNLGYAASLALILLVVISIISQVVVRFIPNR